MAVTESTMIELGQPAPDFDLPVANPDVDKIEGATRSLDDYEEARALVVVFTCNHCPYAKHVEGTLIKLAHSFQPQGVAFVAICSNDAESYPEDSFDAMREAAEKKNYPFPYLQDETQEVARAYGAVCTPDVFVFDSDQKLAYRGRIDRTRPGGDISDGGDLEKALTQLMKQGTVTIDQYPSIGCNIKWKEG